MEDFRQVELYSILSEIKSLRSYNYLHFDISLRLCAFQHNFLFILSQIVLILQMIAYQFIIKIYIVCIICERFPFYFFVILNHSKSAYPPRGAFVVLMLYKPTFAPIHFPGFA